MTPGERRDRDGSPPVDLWIDGDDDAMAAWAARLQTDDAALAAFVERARLHAALRRSLARHALARVIAADGPLAAGTVAGAPAPPARAPADMNRGSSVGSRPRSLGARHLTTAVVIALVLAAVAVRLAGLGLPPHATVTRVVGTTALVAGAAMHGERRRLTAGVVELATPHGGRIVIEAPATFRFESARRLHVTQGRLTADIPPPARGFTVVTPAGEAVDLGTRFGVDVPPTGDAEVHVFAGEVVARGTGVAATSLRDGDAWSLATSSTRSLRTAAFIQHAEIDALAAAVAEGREGVSHEAASRLRADPDLVAWLDFEPPLVAKPINPGPPVTHCRLVQGRWPGSRAADFTAVGDHVAIDVGGGTTWPRLTLAAWVRLDSLGEPYQSLYHTDGWEADNPGQVHWMLTRSGVIRLALRGLVLAADAIERDGHPDGRTSVFGTEGRWIHVATVYDSVARTARFYLDGRFDSQTRLAVAPPARLGPARLGNWNRNDRRLSGRIDDFTILGRALGDDEIRSLHAAGSPYHDVRADGAAAPGGRRPDDARETRR